MPKVRYKPKKFRADARERIEQANEIIEEYLAQGYSLTLRQLYYQFVARDLIANEQREYKRLGDLVNRARLAGLIDWEAIEDRTRNLEILPHWESPAGAVSAVAEQYREDKSGSRRRLSRESLLGSVKSFKCPGSLAGAMSRSPKNGAPGSVSRTSSAAGNAL